MTDDLRTRIAALLEYLRPVTPLEAADAVIRELALDKEFGCPSSDPRHGCRCSHRYVTEWVPADE